MRFLSSLAVALALVLVVACSGGSEADETAPTATQPAAAEPTRAPATASAAQPSPTTQPADTPEAGTPPEPTATSPAAQPTAAPTQPPAPASPPAPTAPPAQAGVAAPIRGYGFPYQQTVPAGTTVVWTNYDSVAHDVTASDDSWSSGLFGEGEAWSRTFSAPGKYAYVCRAHPYMQAVLIVQ